MPFRIIHVLDASTSTDAVEALALLIDYDGVSASGSTHELVVLGHRSTGALLRMAGIPATRGGSTVTWLSSMGWADPTGWRALRRMIDPRHPTLLHAWGIPAAMACAMGGASAGRLVTLTDPEPSRRILAAIDRGTWRASKAGGEGRTRPVQWIGLSRLVVEQLVANGIDAGRVAYVPLAVASARSARKDGSIIREELGLLPQDGPVFLLGGDASQHARHDYGLWAGGILQQIYPRLRVIVREDLRRRQNHGLDRLLDSMADPELPVIAPAEMTWETLLSVADALVVTADGPVAMGAALHAMAARVPVIGTPVAAVREVIEDRRTGLIAEALKPRAIASRMEELMADAALRQQLTAAAHEESITRRSPISMVEAFRATYASGGVVAGI